MREIETLNKRAERYIKSAELLIEDGDYESAVSRTYYAMFFMVEALFLTKDMTFKRHKAIISEFGNHFIKTDIFDKRMVSILSNAFDKRQLGDYEFEPTISKREAGELLKDGKKFCNEIRDYLVKKKKL